MSIRIPLNVTEHPDVELIDYDIIPLRILCLVNFEYKDRVVLPTMAIIDTGAPLSVIPKRIWESCHNRVLGPSHISGIVKGDDYKIPSQVGIITVILIDAMGKGYPITIKADFSSTDDVPLVLGIHDFLSKGIMHLDIKKKDCWLGIP